MQEIDSLLEHIYTKYVSEVLRHQVFGMRNVDLLLYYYNLTDSAAWYGNLSWWILSYVTEVDMETLLVI